MSDIVDVIGEVIDGLIARRYPKCGEAGPDGVACGLERGHWGFHRSAMVAWPNVADSEESWSELGRRLRGGEMPGTNGIPYLSYDELMFAERATTRGARS